MEYWELAAVVILAVVWILLPDNPMPKKDRVPLTQGQVELNNLCRKDSGKLVFKPSLSMEQQAKTWAINEPSYAKLLTVLLELAGTIGNHHWTLMPDQPARLAIEAASEMHHQALAAGNYAAIPKATSLAEEVLEILGNANMLYGLRDYSVKQDLKMSDEHRHYLDVQNQRLSNIREELENLASRMRDMHQLEKQQQAQQIMQRGLAKTVTNDPKLDFELRLAQDSTHKPANVIDIKAAG